MEIKICGIRRPEDIEIINKYKPDYIGFIFAPTRRLVSPQKAAELSAMLNGDTKTVGVFVNAPAEEVKRTVQTVGLDVVQLHGDENEKYIKSLQGVCEMWKAVRVKGGGDIPDIDGVSRILLDRYDISAYGGTGKSFDWTNAGTLKAHKPIVLAGGLTKDNVRLGIELFAPVCVDVSSSVETDGRKDERKVREFIDAVREIKNEQNR